MKKTLYSTTALVAAGLVSFGAGQAFAQAAAPAAPEPLKIAVGGYMTQYVGWASQDSTFENATNVNASYRSFDVKNDSEVYFSGSVKLDNGLTVGVTVQMEADAGATGGTSRLDETYMKISGDFGEAKVGATDAAAFGLGVSAPSVSLSAVSSPTGEYSQFIVKPAAGAASIAGTDIGPGDSNKVAYTSPSLSGFRVGTSYAPGDDTVSNSQPYSTVAKDTWDVAAQWSGAMGDATVRGYVGYWQKTGPAVTDDADTVSLGADVKIADITVGGGYARTTADNAAAKTSTSNPEGTAWNAGVSYATGPWGVSLTYNTNSQELASTTAGDATWKQIVAAAKYNMGPGVDAGLMIARGDYDSENNTAANENTGTVVMGGIKVSF